MKLMKKIDRGSWLSIVLLITGLGVTTPALADMNSQSLHDTAKHLKNKSEGTNTGREVMTKHLQQNISARSQAVKQGTHTTEEINRTRQKIIRNIR